METMTTGEAATAAGTTERRIQQLIRDGKLPRPPKRNGKRVWGKRDRENLRVALERNS